MGVADPVTLGCGTVTRDRSGRRVAREPVNLKAAPRQQIVEINRVGSWGRVEYHHLLDCGHTEIRKRAASTKTLACPGCVLAAKHEAQQSREQKLMELMDPADDLLDLIGSEMAASERTAAQVRAGLSARLGVPPEAVDVATDVDDEGRMRVSYAVILLSVDEIARLIR